MEYIVLDLNQVTEDQLRAAIDCNSRTYHLMTSEIAKLKKVSDMARSEISIEDELTNSPSQLEDTTSVDEDFENEVEYYYSAIKELSLDNLEEQMLDSLPSRKNYQYQRILLRIKAEIMRNIKDLKDFLREEKISLVDALELKDEFLLEKEKISIIDQQLRAKQLGLEEETISEENNLIFVPTTGGNIRVLEEIDRIDPEYYDRFNGLFQSIKDGTFKNVKRFSRNSDLAGLCEVKDFKTRVVFKRLNKNTYAIISAFIKKADSDKGYRNMLSSRYKDYQSMEQSLIENSGKEEFIDLNHQYEEELFTRLGQTFQPTKLIKIGGGK